MDIFNLSIPYTFKSRLKQSHETQVMRKIIFWTKYIFMIRIKCNFLFESNQAEATKRLWFKSKFIVQPHDSSQISLQHFYAKFSQEFHL